MDNERIDDARFCAALAAQETAAVNYKVDSSKVQFRNIKVTDLADKTLFEGLPPQHALAAAPAYWRFFGTAAISKSD